MFCHFLSNEIQNRKYQQWTPIEILDFCPTPGNRHLFVNHNCHHRNYVNNHGYQPRIRAIRVFPVPEIELKATTPSADMGRETKAQPTELLYLLSMRSDPEGL